MGMFPDEFPFKREEPAVEAGAEPAIETSASPVIEPPMQIPRVELPFPERRRSPRQVLTARASLRVDGQPSPVSVEMSNISLLGVRFHSEQAMDVGQRGQIRLEVGPLRWNARLRVITCMRDDWGRFCVGCEFVGNELVRPYPVAA